MRPSSESRWLALSLGAGLAATLFLFLANLWFAPLNQDEGWYLMAARRVAEGHVPYRDFAFTQGPVMPAAYALATPLVRAQGLLGGRLYTVGLALACLVLTAGAARKTMGWEGVAMVIALLGANSFHSQYSSTVKTYALAGLWLIAGTRCFAATWRSGRAGSAAAAAFFFVCAAGTRLSLGLFLPVLGLSLLAARQRLGQAPWLAFGAAGAAGLTLLFGTFFALAPENTWFGLVAFHGGREVANPWLLKAGFLSRMVQSYTVACVLMASLPLLPRGKNARGFPFRPLWISLALVSVTHLAAPFPYDDYQAALYPLAVLLLVLDLGDRLPEGWKARACALLVLAALAGTAASPVLQDWFLLRRDRIWWRTKAQSDLSLLRTVARDIRAVAPEATRILTPDLYLAIEANLDVPPGFEMGPFSFFPDWSDKQARQHRVLNARLAEETILESDAPLAATSGYAFRINNPGIVETGDGDFERIDRALREAYEPWKTIPDFGQGLTELTLWKRKLP